MKKQDPKALVLHPDAELIPPMRPAEYRNFLADVRQHGIQVPLEVQGNIVLDGRHRLRVALELGLAVVPVVQVTPADPLGHIMRTAVLRRHLTDDQRAMIAAKWAKAHPVPRGGDRKSMKARGLRRVQGGVSRHPARLQAAITFGVPPGKVKKAMTLLNNSPELADRVHAGEMRFATAIWHLRGAPETSRTLPAVLARRCQTQLLALVELLPRGRLSGQCRRLAVTLGVWSAKQRGSSNP